MANKYSSQAISGYNSSPPPDDGSTTAANEITWSGIKGKLGDPVKNQAAAIDSAALTAFGQQFGYSIESISTNITLGSTDTNKFISVTGSPTITLPAVATAGTSTLYAIINSGSGTVTIDGNGSETIDTALTITLAPGQFALLGTDGSSWVSVSNRKSSPLRGHCAGLTLSRNAGSPNTKIDVAAGQATDDTNVASMVLGSTATIDTGTVGANGLDAGTLALSTWYHAYLIAKLDGTTAGLLSTSVSSPTLPSGYVFKRRIGSVKTNGSTQFIDFSQNGDEFLWTTSVADQNPATVTSSASLLSVTVPPGVKVNVLFRASETNASASNVIFTSPDETDQASGVPQNDLTNSAAGATVSGRFNVRTNTSQQIRCRAAVASTSVYIGTYGWIDTRGRFA